MKVFKMLTDEKNKLKKKQLEESFSKEIKLKNINFFLINDFIYYKDKKNERNRLCIFKSLK